MSSDNIDIQKELENENKSFKPDNLDKKLKKEGFRQSGTHCSIDSTGIEYMSLSGELLVISLSETLDDETLGSHILDSEPEDMSEEIHDYLVEEGFNPVRTYETETVTYQNTEEGYNLHIDAISKDYPSRRAAERAYEDSDN